MCKMGVTGHSTCSSNGTATSR